MAGNQLLTSEIIVKRALAVFSEKVRVLGMVNRQYDDQFGFKSGSKNGDQVFVRVPQRAVIRKGRTMEIQDQVNKVIPVKVDNYYGVDTGATSAEMALQIDDYQRQFIDPKIGDLLANVEADFINKVTPLVPASVGNYGAFDDPRIALSAKAYLDSQLAPATDRNLIINTYSQIDIVNSLKGLYNPQGTLDKQFREGQMASNTLGFDWFSSNLTASVTRGSGAGYTVKGKLPAGDTIESFDIAEGKGTINPGDTFTIAGVYAVHPQTKKVLVGQLQKFTVKESVFGPGSIHVSPALIPSGSEQNVSNVPADKAAITIEGTADTPYVQNLAFTKDAFYFVTADLPTPPKSHGVDAAQASYQGITLRFMQGFNQTNDTYISRFDLMWGGGILRPELAVRIPATVSRI